MKAPPKTIYGVSSKSGAVVFMTEPPNVKLPDWIEYVEYIEASIAQGLVDAIEEMVNYGLNPLDDGKQAQAEFERIWNAGRAALDTYRKGVGG
jgi:hypothetical protein